MDLSSLQPLKIYAGAQSLVTELHGLFQAQSYASQWELQPRTASETVFASVTPGRLFDVGVKFNWWNF